MRKVRWVFVSLVLLVMTSTAHATPSGRACGGRTAIDNGAACCLSGTVTIGGKPIAGAEVAMQHAEGGKAVVDVTSIVGNDGVPTYGFVLHDAPLYARPGDVLLITVTTKGWTRTVNYTVVAGEQWRDIALDARMKDTP